MSDMDNEYEMDSTIKAAQARLLEMLLSIAEICEKHGISYWLDGGSALGAARHKGFIPWDDDVDIALLRKDYFKLIKVLETELPERFALQNRALDKAFHLPYSRVVDKNSYVEYRDGHIPTRKLLEYQGLFVDIVYVERGFLSIRNFVNILYKPAFYHQTLYNSLAKRVFAKVMWPLVQGLVGLLRFFNFLFPKDDYVFGYGISFQRKLKISEILPVVDVEFEGCVVKGPYDIHSYLHRYFGDYLSLPPVHERKTHAAKIEVYY